MPLSKLEIKLVSDYHSVPKVAERFTEYMKGFDPKTTVALLEAIPSTHDLHAKLYSRGEIRFGTFWSRLNLGNHWNPAEPYRGLLKYAGEVGMQVRSLDTDIPTRQAIARSFRDLAVKLIRTGWNEETSMEYEWCVAELGLKRENVFCGSINGVKYGNSNFSNKKTALVFAGKSHLLPIACDFGRYQVDDIEIPPLFDSEEENQYSKEEDAIALEEAERRKILESEETPPLVPAVVQAFVEVADARAEASKEK